MFMLQSPRLETKLEINSRNFSKSPKYCEIQPFPTTDHEKKIKFEYKTI